MLRSTVLLFLLWCARARAVAFEDCGSVDNAVSIDISGCSTPPCNIVAGSSRNVTSTYKAVSESSVLYLEVYLRLNLITIFLDATPPPCAAGSETVCPVRAGDFSRYNAIVNFDEDLPPVSGYLYWRLYNNQGTTVACYKVAVSIVYDIKALKSLQP
jgi:hypothetical protein